MRLKQLFIGTAGAGLAVIAFSAFSARKEKTIPVVQNFQVGKYLGKWYEIARLDFRWEKNLTQCTAEYALRDDGKIRVTNRGYDTIKKRWNESIGKAKFAGEKNAGALKVSFFGPFYAEYNVVALDPGYRYALVLGKTPEYMWILSRERTVPENIRQEYLSKAKSLGVKTEELVWTAQN